MNGKVVGFVKTEVRDSIFHEPRSIGVIQELYILPQFRRKGVGRLLVSQAMGRPCEKAGMTMAEFPSMNSMAVSF